MSPRASAAQARFHTQEQMLRTRAILGHGIAEDCAAVDRGVGNEGGRGAGCPRGGGPEGARHVRIPLLDHCSNGNVT